MFPKARLNWRIAMDLKKLFGILAILPMLGGAVYAGDAEKGESDFKRCKACHAIIAADGTAIVKGGQTGPNLFGLIGRTVGTLEGFKYGDAIVAAGAAGTVWTEENLATYVTDPGAFLQEVLGDPGAKSMMTFKLKKGGEDMAAYLATLGP
jgi:cytochrome c